MPERQSAQNEGPRAIAGARAVSNRVNPWDKWNNWPQNKRWFRHRLFWGYRATVVRDVPGS